MLRREDAIIHGSVMLFVLPVFTIMSGNTSLVISTQHMQLCRLQMLATPLAIGIRAKVLLGVETN